MDWLPISGAYFFLALYIFSIVPGFLIHWRQFLFPPEIPNILFSLRHYFVVFVCFLFPTHFSIVSSSVGAVANCVG